jgi:hypothetical protein
MKTNNDYNGKLCITPRYRRIHAPSPDEFADLCRKLAELVKMYDQMARQMPAGDAKDLAEDISEQIITTLSLCDGCSVIANESTFDSRRHTPVPFSIVEDGTPIQSFHRVGIAIGEQVIIPAKVKIS